MKNPSCSPLNLLPTLLHFLSSCLQTYMVPLPPWKRTLIWTCCLFWPLSCLFPSFHSQTSMVRGPHTAFSFSLFMNLLNLFWVFNLFPCSAALNAVDHPFVRGTNCSWKDSYNGAIVKVSTNARYNWYHYYYYWNTGLHSVTQACVIVWKQLY